MVSPYLIFDRQGSGVDINMHDKKKSCYGCPDRVAEPRCHMTCEGYKARQEATELAQFKRANTYYSPDDKTYAQRERNAGERRRRKGIKIK